MILHKCDRKCRFYIFCSDLMDLTAFLHIISGKLICSCTSGLALPFQSHGSSLGARYTSGSSGSSTDTWHLLVGRSYLPAVERPEGSTVARSLVRHGIVRAPCSHCLRAQHQPRVASGVSQFLPAGLRVKPAALIFSCGATGSAAKSGGI